MMRLCLLARRRVLVFWFQGRQFAHKAHKVRSANRQEDPKPDQAQALYRLGARHHQHCHSGLLAGG